MDYQMAEKVRDNTSTPVSFVHDLVPQPNVLLELDVNNEKSQRKQIRLQDLKLFQLYFLGNASRVVARLVALVAAMYLKAAITITVSFNFDFGCLILHLKTA